MSEVLQPRDAVSDSPLILIADDDKATRVLLRRLPWLVLVRPDCHAMLEHLLLLAKERGVEVVDYPDMPYSCIGLVRPQAGDDA